MKITNKEVLQSYILTTAKYDYSVYEKRILYRIIEILQFLIEGKKLNEKYSIQITTQNDYDFQIPLSSILVNEKGIPLAEGTPSYLGNPNPKFIMGFNNSFNIGKLGISFLIDGKFDYEVMSVTQALLDGYGVSKATGDARANGHVAINGVTTAGAAVTSVDPQAWYESTGGMSPVSSQYIYDGTVVRLRELTVGYDFNIKDSFFKKLRVNAVGRNLFYITKKAPFDPEVTMSTGNSLSGVDIFMMPATRNYGLTLNATF